MKAVIIGACLLLIAAGAAAQTGSVQQQQTEKAFNHQVDQNTKSITLLSIGISALFTFCASLIVYIRKMHARHIQMATKFVEATMAVNNSTEKLAESIRQSGDSISKAVMQQERTINDLHKYILSAQK